MRFLILPHMVLALALAIAYTSAHSLISESSDADSLTLAPRLYHTSFALPAPLGKGRQPPRHTRSTTHSAGLTKPAGKDRKEQVKTKKQKYANIKKGKEFVNQVLGGLEFPKPTFDVRSGQTKWAKKSRR